MKSSPLINDASLATAAVLGALSFGAMLSLANALPCEKPLEEIGVDLEGPQEDFGVVVTEHIIQEHELEKPIPEFVVCAKAKPRKEAEECSSGDCPSGRERSTKLPEDAVIVEVEDVQILEAPDHVIRVDKDGRIKCGRAQKSVDGADFKKPHPPIPQDRPIFIDGPKEKIADEALAGPDEGKAPIADAQGKVGPVNAAFDTHLYQILKQGEGNVFFSPYSITECMAMVYAGSGGNTATEIGRALSFGKDAKLTSAELKRLRSHLSQALNQADQKLRIANALCVTGLAPKQAYQDLVRDEFDSEIFSGGLGEINGWAKKKTEGKIERILDKLSPDSACVLLNAVYFKGDWRSAFKANDTHKANFHLTRDDKVKVDMMKQKGGFKVLRDNGMTIVELPYRNSASMVLMLPDKPEGMAALETHLNEGLLLDLGERLSQAQPERIELHLPKFKIETKSLLIPAMQKLGMKDAFVRGKADFSVMYDRSDVKIEQIVHKAILEVDEKGSVAAAVTAVEFGLESYRPPEQLPKVRFDRPFITLIRDRDTGTNLFMGRISDPTK